MSRIVLYLEPAKSRILSMVLRLVPLLQLLILVDAGLTRFGGL